jgi:hypothetical protein
MATKFNMKDPNPGAWFKFDEDDPGSGRIRIRSLNIHQRNEIRKQCCKPKVDYHKGARFTYDDINEDLFSRLLWDYCLAEWTGLEDDDGDPIPCNTDTKADLMMKNPNFALFVNDCLEKLNEDDSVAREIEEKNLLPGSKDSGKNQTVKSAGK